MNLNDAWCIDALGQPRVLIVEDEGQMADVLAGFCREGGALVRIAENGEQGLESIEAFDPDVVIADLQMPLLRGDEMLVELRRRGFKKPVIILTGFGNEEATIHALRYDAFDFLEKTVPKDILIAVIQKALRLEGERVFREKLIDDLFAELSRAGGKPFKREEFERKVRESLRTQRKA